MDYRQDSTPRTCQVCLKPILFGAHMLPLFSDAPEITQGKPDPSINEWCHTSCAKKAVETWLLKKRSKQGVV